MHFGRISDSSETKDRVDPARHTGAILRERVDLLYASMYRAAAIAFAVAALYIYACVGHTDEIVPILWLAGMVGVLGLRVLAAYLFLQHRTLLDDTRDWLTVFQVGASITAVGWGIAGILFFPADDIAMQAMTVLVLSGISAGSLTSLSPDFPTYRNYVVLTLTPLVTLAITRGGEQQLLIALLGVLLIAFLLKSGSQGAQTIEDSLKLRHENTELVDNLRQEKARVMCEAEAMLSSLLLSAPVALWTIDERGVVTMKKGRKLREGEARMLPPIGKSILAEFENKPQIAYDTQRVLDGETLTTEVELGRSTYEVHYNPAFDEQGRQQGAIGVAIDITDRVEHKKELSRRANYDDLTGLPNRTLIMNQVEHAFENARRYNSHVALFFLDLDNFKAVNDTLGHEAGDQLLRLAAERLGHAIRLNDMPARLGGDEFLVVGEELAQAQDAEVIAHKIANLFQRPFNVEKRDVYATTSIGVAVFPQDGDTAEQLLRSADTAMYHAKAAGKNKYRFFTPEMQETAERHLAMETELRHAVSRNELRLAYQPKFDTVTGQILGAEALLRWESPLLGSVSPVDFIPAAEFAGLMPQIGNWVLQTACREAASWQSLCERSIHVAINVSPQQFRGTDLLANVTQALVDNDLTANVVELEITESVLVQDARETLRVFQDLSDLGIPLSLDDFGTGYSSLSYLKKFPLQVLKVDRAFVQDLGNSSDDDSLVDAIIAMAHSLNLRIVAEGVETHQQFEYLKQRGVEMVQGYLFSKPVSDEAFRTMLMEDAPLNQTTATVA